MRTRRLTKGNMQPQPQSPKLQTFRARMPSKQKGWRLRIALCWLPGSTCFLAFALCFFLSAVCLPVCFSVLRRCRPLAMWILVMVEFRVYRVGLATSAAGGSSWSVVRQATRAFPNGLAALNPKLSRIVPGKGRFYWFHADPYQ